MNLKAIADETIPAAHNKFIQIKKRYSTGDIVDEVLQCFRESSWQLKEFAPYLRGENVKETCGNVWNFLKKNVKYKVDPEEVQWVKEPAKTWEDKQCDCKSYSIFIASCLKNLGIKGCFRFVSFNDEPEPTHVYIIVRNQGQDIIIDDVMPQFNKEAQYISKKDYPMQGLYRVSGLPSNASIKGALPVVSGMGKISINPAHKGLFTRKAEREGMTVKQFGRHVLAHKNDYPLQTIREAVFYENERNWHNHHRIGSLPVIGCMEDDPHVGSIFDNIFRGIKKTLSQSQADQYVIQLAPALLYRYIPAPFLKFTGNGVDSFFSSLPSIVQQKVHACDNLLNYMHDNWAQDYYHTDHLLHHTLTGLLGMEPQHYLATVINSVIDSFQNTTATAIGSLDVSNFLQQYGGSGSMPSGSGNMNWGGILSNTGESAASGTAAGGPAAGAATGALTFITSLLSGLSRVNLPDSFNIQSIAPQPGDWSGYQTKMQTFVVTPTHSDPLGSGLNNGLYDANGNAIPGVNRSLLPGSTQFYGTPAIRSGMSPLIMIGLAGAAAMMFFGHKKKGARK
ncbi:MAG: hypothetical protein EPN37_15595 [Chitinophagaceae bacterium]|nr:MAG: hypothetical protein EPN37_15595 [Chitinophagaceae bacterium]